VGLFGFVMGKVAGSVVGESGLGRHLDERVVVSKKGTEYLGILGVDGEDKYFVAPDFMWDNSGQENSVDCENENAMVYINRPGEDKVSLLGRGYRVGSGQRVDQFREFTFVSKEPLRYRANVANVAKKVRVMTAWE